MTGGASENGDDPQTLKSLWENTSWIVNKNLHVTKNII